MAVERYKITKEVNSVQSCVMKIRVVDTKPSTVSFVAELLLNLMLVFIAGMVVSDATSTFREDKVEATLIMLVTRWQFYRVIALLAIKTLSNMIRSKTIVTEELIIAKYVGV